MGFQRDIKIGYPSADASIVTALERLETLVTSGNTATSTGLDDLIERLENSLEELRRIRATAELTLGQEVTEV